VKITTALVIIVLLMAFFGSLECANKKAENDDYRVAISGNVGVAINFKEPGGFETFGVEGLRYSKSNIMSVSYLYKQEWDTFSSNPSYESMNYLSFMFGKYGSLGIMFFQLQAGISVNFGLIRGEFVESNKLGDLYFLERESTFGLPIKLGVKFELSEHWRFGLNFNANINNYESLFIPMFSLEYGKIR